MPTPSCFTRIWQSQGERANEAEYLREVKAPEVSPDSGRLWPSYFYPESARLSLEDCPTFPENMKLHWQPEKEAITSNKVPMLGYEHFLIIGLCPGTNLLYFEHTLVNVMHLPIILSFATCGQQWIVKSLHKTWLDSQWNNWHPLKILVFQSTLVLKYLQLITFILSVLIRNKNKNSNPFGSLPHLHV